LGWKTRGAERCLDLLAVTPLLLGVKVSGLNARSSGIHRLETRLLNSLVVVLENIAMNDHGQSD